MVEVGEALAQGSAGTVLAVRVLHDRQLVLVCWAGGEEVARYVSDPSREPGAGARRRWTTPWASRARTRSRRRAGRPEAGEELAEVLDEGLDPDEEIESERLSRVLGLLELPAWIVTAWVLPRRMPVGPSVKDLTRLGAGRTGVAGWLAGRRGTRRTPPPPRTRARRPAQRERGSRRPDVAVMQASPDAEEAWRRRRRWAYAAFVLGLAIFVAWFGIPTDRIGLAALATGFLPIGLLGKGWRAWGRMLLDWLPFQAVLLAYDYSRGFASPYSRRADGRPPTTRPRDVHNDLGLPLQVHAADRLRPVGDATARRSTSRPPSGSRSTCTRVRWTARRSRGSRSW